MDDLLEDESRGVPVLADDVDRMIESIANNDGRTAWKRNTELNLGSRRWRPSAVSADGSRLLYVCLQQEIPRHVSERLTLAKAQGIFVTVAAGIDALYRPQIVEVLVAVDSDVLIVDDYRVDRRFDSRHVLAAIADIEVPFEPEARIQIANDVWARIEEGTSHEKGRRLEALLAFIFSQVQDFKVVERNFRNESEEIDLVLQIDNFSRRAWQLLGAPFILVEAKNRIDKASQQMISVLLTKLQTKRKTARIGIMVSPAGFTEDAKIQELRFSTQDICISMIDKPTIEALLSAVDLDDELESIIRRSLLR